MNSSIYSIGHGNKSMEQFIDELEAYNIKYLLDVRSKPFSKWKPEFNQEPLKAVLQKRGITYVFLGDQLGGRPDDISCYDENGKIIYNIVKEKLFFKQGLQRLINANSKQIKLAIMCSCQNPEKCHRTKLIGVELEKKQVSLNHIISTTEIKSQEFVIYEITKGIQETDLFGNIQSLTSRKSYLEI